MAALGACASDVDGVGGGPPLGGRADDGSDAPEGPPEAQVELKVTIAPSAIEDARWWFDIESDDDAEARAVTFYDTRYLDLYGSGVILRAREIVGDDDDSTVKIRPMLPEEAWARDEDLFDDDDFKCEIDRTLDGSVSSCSLSATQDTGEIDLVAEGERDVDQLFSSEQEDFFGAFAPAYVDMDDTIPLGPTDTLQWKVDVAGLPRLTIELWEMPDGTDVMELSTKVDQASADVVMADLLDLLTWLELPLDSEQAPKTRRVLEFYAAR